MFKYTPEDVDCRNCIEFKRKGGCASVHCPYVAERVEAGVVGYDEAVAETFRSVPAIRLRLVYMVSTFPGTLWYDEGHERRMNSISYYTRYNRRKSTNEYYAAIYLLSADRDLHRRAINAYTRKGIAFDRIKRRGITEQGYTLLGAAKTIYLATNDVTLADLVDHEIIDTESFRLFVNAMLIARYGKDILQIRNTRSAYKLRWSPCIPCMASVQLKTPLGRMVEME